MKADSPLLQTLSSGFCAVKESREVVEGTFARWQNSILKPLGAAVTSQDMSGSPSELISALFPLVSPVYTKLLFFEAGNGWVIIFDNGYRGTDASVAWVLSDMCKCLAVRVTSQPHTFSKISGEGHYGAEIFEAYEAGAERRIVYCANDGGKWKFGQSGTPYPVENVDNYGANPIRKRFSHADLVGILNFLGVNVFDSAVLGGSRVAGTLYTRTGKPPINYCEHAPER